MTSCCLTRHVVMKVYEIFIYLFNNKYRELRVMRSVLKQKLHSHRGFSSLLSQHIMTRVKGRCDYINDCFVSRRKILVVFKNKNFKLKFSTIFFIIFLSVNYFLDNIIWNTSKTALCLLSSMSFLLIWTEIIMLSRLLTRLVSPMCHARKFYSLEYILYLYKSCLNNEYF